MGLFDIFFSKKTKQRYMQNGFTQEQAAAMAWICAQKAAGKLVGATSGLFLALTWGHYHDRIFHYLKFRGNKPLFQLGIVMGSIVAGDYFFTGRRRGANELFANYLYMNNNLFLANLDSLVQNFDIFTRKFTPQQIEAFNFRRNLLRTNHHQIENKKWIYNPEVYTPQEFQKRVKSATQAPWTDIKEYSSKYGKQVVSAPVNIGKLIDQTGDKLGITQYFIYGWSPIH